MVQVHRGNLNSSVAVIGYPGMLASYVARVIRHLFPDYSLHLFGRREYDLSSVKQQEALLDCLEGIATSQSLFIVNCAGVIPHKNRTDEEVMAVNGLWPKNIADRFYNHIRVKVIHITTDCVYSGEKPYPGGYREDDVSDCSTVYGKSKFSGEDTRLCIIRTSIIGRELKTPGVSLLEVVRRAEGAMNGYSNHFWNGVTCYQLGLTIASMLKAGLYDGVCHLFSNSVSKYFLVKDIAKAYKLSLRVIPTIAPKTINRCLGTIYKVSPFVLPIPSISVQLEDQVKFDLTFPPEDLYSNYLHPPFLLPLPLSDQGHISESIEEPQPQETGDQEVLHSESHSDLLSEG